MTLDITGFDAYPIGNPAPLWLARTSVVVCTARIGCKDPDAFNITRKTGGKAGAPFAPSWALLGPVLKERREAKAMRDELPKRLEDVARIRPDVVETIRQNTLAMAEKLERSSWTDYVPEYIAEMEASYDQHPDAWAALLGRTRVVLLCYCGESERCHRSLLQAILVALGATDGGELVKQHAQMGLFG